MIKPVGQTENKLRNSFKKQMEKRILVVMVEKRKTKLFGHVKIFNHFVRNVKKGSSVYIRRENSE